MAASTFFTEVLTSDLIDLFLSALFALVRMRFFADLMLAKPVSSVMHDSILYQF
jgi:hypothetical protein